MMSSAPVIFIFSGAFLDAPRRAGGENKKPRRLAPAGLYKKGNLYRAALLTTTTTTIDGQTVRDPALGLCEYCITNSYGLWLGFCRRQYFFENFTGAQLREIRAQ
jgi:hypothetical protein